MCVQRHEIEYKPSLHGILADTLCCAASKTRAITHREQRTIVMDGGGRTRPGLVWCHNFPTNVRTNDTSSAGCPGIPHRQPSGPKTCLLTDGANLQPIPGSLHSHSSVSKPSRDGRRGVNFAWLRQLLICTNNKHIYFRHLHQLCSSVWAGQLIRWQPSSRRD